MKQIGTFLDNVNGKKVMAFRDDSEPNDDRIYVTIPQSSKEMVNLAVESETMSKRHRALNRYD